MGVESRWNIGMELTAKLLGNGVVEPSFDVVGVMEYCLAEIFVDVQLDKAAVSTWAVYNGRLYFGRHFSRRRSSEIRRQEYPAKLLISRRTCQFGDQLQFGEWEYADSRVSPGPPG